MSRPTALVTGASGFVGRALVSRLQDLGWVVTVLVRRAEGAQRNVDTVMADLREPVGLGVVLAGRHFDVVFHLAAAGVAPQDREAAAIFAANASGTGALVQACARSGVPAFVYAGSCSEYESTSASLAISEDAPLTRTNLYGASKAAGGLWGSAIARELGMTFCWLRFFGIFGPGEGPDRLLPYLAGRLSRGQAVDLTFGEQVRDLTYIDDAVAALLLAAGLAHRGEGGPFNVCSGIGTPIRDLACMVADGLHRPLELLHFGARPYRADEPMHLVGDPGRFRKAAGYEPRVGVDRGVPLALDAWGLR